MTKLFSLIGITLIISNGMIFAQNQKIDSLEIIGQHLSDLLIARGNISESEFAINIERLYPDKDFSEFEDSPAEFILAMLYGAQLLLPETWSELLQQAENFRVNKKAKYYKTYYNESAKESFILTCVLKQSSKYYAFSAVVLGWDDDKYVMRIFKKMKVFNDIEELERNIFSIAIEEEKEELQELNGDSTNQNTEPFSF